MVGRQALGRALALSALLPAGRVQARDSSLRVLPWNGFKAALSLTFDDGDPGQLPVVVPELDRRGLRATFNLIADGVSDEAGWKKAAAAGHEIGSHSLEHRHPSEFTAGEERRQVVEAQARLEKMAGTPILTFAYPFAEITPGLRQSVLERHFIARGGWGSRYDLPPGQEPDWGDIPSLVTRTQTRESVYRGWVGKALDSGAWSVLQFHAVEGAAWGYEPVPLKVFMRFMAFLEKRRKKIWIAPFGEVGAYWKAQFILERSVPKQQGTTQVWTWVVPKVFPAGTHVKIRFEGEGPSRVWQGDRVLDSEGRGVYAVAFDEGRLGASWEDRK